MNRETTMIRVFNKSKNRLPEYQTPGSSGMDLMADISSPLSIMPNAIIMIPTGLYLEIPPGIEGQIRARSGLARKHGVTLINGIGTVDSDYRGEICAAMINLGPKAYEIVPGERIAQIVFAKYESIIWREVRAIDDLTETDRGSGGFGHSGS